MPSFRFALCVSAMLVLVTCVRPSTSHGSTYAPAVASIVTRAPSLVGDPAEWVRRGVDAVVVLVAGDAVAVASLSGRTRWTVSEGATALALSNDTVAYGMSDGTLAIRSTSAGAVEHRIAGSCPPSLATHDGARIDALFIGPQIVVGCDGRDVVAFDRTTAKRLARASDAAMSHIRRIAPIGRCATPSRVRATARLLASHLEVLDCKTLRAISSDRTDTQLLGVAGDVAALGDRCCHAYEVPKLVTIDLRTGRTSEARPLTPSPVIFENETSEATVADSSLVVFAGTSMYRYGDVRSPRRPMREALSLIDVPQIMARDRIAARLGHDDADAVDVVLKIDGSGTTALWKAPEAHPVVFGL